MFRSSIQPAVAGKSSVTNTSPNKREPSNSGAAAAAAADHSNATSTIREIRGRPADGSAGPAGVSARQLLANRRQAMSMERLNGSTVSGVPPSASMNSMHSLGDRGDKSSPMNGSSNSIGGSTASSPSRGSSASSNGGLNRTASRVSRFKSAKAVFERLSSVNSAAAASAAAKPDRQALAQAPERPRGTVASRYAAAAAARSAAAQGASAAAAAACSPRSRPSGRKSPLKSSSSTDQSARGSLGTSNGPQASRPTAAAPNSPKQDQRSQPRPQPRVITTASRRTPVMTASQPAGSGRSPPDSHQAGRGAARATPTKSSGSAAAPSATSQASSQPKPPPKDLIDKIVLEIVRDAKNEHDANCTIQDLSNCDTSGIPETLDFDKCFQDVEMMTEEEARKLLSRKSDSPPARLTDDTPADVTLTQQEESELANSEETQPVGEEAHQYSSSSAKVPTLQQDGSPVPIAKNYTEQSSDSLVPPLPGQHQGGPMRAKVRFSDEPVTVYDTHAASDYDRRNDDIDPVAASAEYEIEKSREREGIFEDELDEGAALIKQLGDGRHRELAGAVVESFIQQHPSTKTYEDYQAGSHTPQSAAAAAAARGGDHRDSSDNWNPRADEDADGQLASSKDYIESLEREVSIKRILEQNLRDLQSQYYETVKQLDGYKEQAEARISKLEDELVEVGNRHESAQSELADARDQSNQYEKQLNDIKESSQLLEKKYHRAKRIIKDMQSREESFTRREQLYQQKLDEIEHELSVLIETINRTIHEDGLKYFSINSQTDGSSCTKQHQTRLDVLGLIKQMMDNFNGNKKTQSAQIKQRIVTMLEQHLASLLAGANGCASVTTGPVVPIPPIVPSSTSKQILATKTSATKSRKSSSNNNDNNNNDDEDEDDTRKRAQSYSSYASHRLSQPNMPHPIGVGGQPTKIFHGLNSMPISATLNEPSPPQSVNSYPSTNSLNSLNNNNNNNNNGQQVVGSSAANHLINLKLQDHQLASLGDVDPAPQTTTSLNDEVFQRPSTDAQTPYQTNEWHDKPVSEWTTTQVSTWLLALGLDQYISKFEDRNVNGQSLINLDSTVLKGLGVLNSNDRNLLKKKIRELRVEMEKERKIIEKKMKETLREKSKVQTPSQTGKQSWKKSLLS